MSAETIWRWFCSLSEAELVESGEPILEIKLPVDPAGYDFEPLLIDDAGDEDLPELTLH